MKQKRNFVMLLILLGSMTLLGGCSSDDNIIVVPPPVNPDLSYTVEFFATTTDIPSGASQDIDFTIAGPGAIDMKFEVDGAKGWKGEVTSITQTTAPSYNGVITALAPNEETLGKITLYITNKKGEIRSHDFELSSYMVEPEPEDLYSTKNNYINIVHHGGSPVAITIIANPKNDTDTEKYYYDILSAAKVHEYSVRIGEEWKDTWRDNVYLQLNGPRDYWDYGESAYRFSEYDNTGSGEVESLTSDTYYYVYTVVVKKGGALAPLELTRVRTTPINNKPFNPQPATRVTLEYEATYDKIDVDLSPSSLVNGYYYNLVDQHSINSYIAMYGTKWDSGFLDKWYYYLSYEDTEALSYTQEGYQWTNLVPSSTYYLFAVYFDHNNELHLELTPITTAAKDPVIGTPRVQVQLTAITSSTASFRLTPSEDCGNYTVDIWSEPDLALWREKHGHKFYQELINWATRYGRITSGAQTLTLDINDFYPKGGGESRTWSENRYDLVIMPFDKKGVYDETGISYTHISHSNQDAINSLPTSKTRNIEPFKRIIHEDIKQQELKLSNNASLSFKFLAP